MPARAMDADLDLAREGAFAHLAIERRAGKAGAGQNCFQSNYAIGIVHGAVSSRQDVARAPAREHWIPRGPGQEALWGHWGPVGFAQVSVGGERRSAASKGVSRRSVSERHTRRRNFPTASRIARRSVLNSTVHGMASVRSNRSWLPSKSWRPARQRPTLRQSIPRRKGWGTVVPIGSNSVPLVLISALRRVEPSRYVLYITRRTGEPPSYASSRMAGSSVSRGRSGFLIRRYAMP